MLTMFLRFSASDDEHIPNDVYFGTPDIEVLQ